MERPLMRYVAMRRLSGLNTSSPTQARSLARAARTPSARPDGPAAPPLCGEEDLVHRPIQTCPGILVMGLPGLQSGCRLWLPFPLLTDTLGAARGTPCAAEPIHPAGKQATVADAPVRVENISRRATPDSPEPAQGAKRAPRGSGPGIPPVPRSC